MPAPAPPYSAALSAFIANYTYHLQLVNQDGTRSWYGATSTRLLPQ